MTKRTYDEYVTAFKILKYSFRMNKMDDSIECNGERMSDGLAAKIESQMIDTGFPSALDTRRNWTRLAFENSYHPIIEYLDNLQWLGQDELGQLLNCFDFEHDEISRVFLRKWLLGCVGKVYGQDQNYMLVIDGNQGLGKSYFARWLSGSMSRYFVEGALNPDSNDTKLRVVSNWIWEVGELQYTTRKSDIEALKNIITQVQMTVRPPYGRYDIEKYVLANFIGTINETGAGFLNDPTGTRRFAVIKTRSIDWSYTKLNVEQLWAQIVTQYKAGERGTLTPEEKNQQALINAGYDTTSTTLELLLMHYEIDTNTIKEWIPIAKIVTDLELLGLKGNQYQNQKEIASALTKLGCPKSNSNLYTGYGRLTCYQGVKKK